MSSSIDYVVEDIISTLTVTRVVPGQILCKIWTAYLCPCLHLPALERVRWNAQNLWHWAVIWGCLIPVTHAQDVTKEHFSLPSLGPKLESLRDEVRFGRGWALIRGVPVQRYRCQAAVDTSPNSHVTYVATIVRLQLWYMTLRNRTEASIDLGRHPESG